METQVLTFRTIIEKDDRGYPGYVPALPGCHTQGNTIEETRKNLKEAIEGMLLVMKKYHQPIPQETGIEVIETIYVGELFSSSKLTYV